MLPCGANSYWPELRLIFQPDLASTTSTTSPFCFTATCTFGSSVSISSVPEEVRTEIITDKTMIPATPSNPKPTPRASVFFFRATARSFASRPRCLLVSAAAACCERVASARRSTFFLAAVASAWGSPLQEGRDYPPPRKEAVASVTERRGCRSPLACACFQGGNHFGHGLVTVFGPLGDHLLVHGIQLRRHVGPGLAERRDGRLAVRQENLDQRLALVQDVARQQPIQGAAQRVDVGAGVGVVGVQGLLGSHVVAGAHHLARAGQAIPVGVVRQSGDARQAHVEDLHRAFLVQQQVAGLDVAVDNLVLVGILEPSGGLDDVIHRLRQSAAVPVPCTMAARSLPSTYSITR